MSTEFKLVPVEPTSEMTLIGQRLRYDAVNSIGEIYRQMLSRAPQPPALGGELVPRYDVHWNDQLVVQYPDGDFCKWEDVFKLQAEIERLTYELKCSKGLANLTKGNLDEANEERDQLKARCDELERRAADVVEGLHGQELPGAMTMRIRKLKDALSNPVGSES